MKKFLLPTQITIDQIEKIGHSLIFFGKKVSELSKTKLLKLLFLLEEKSIMDYGTPFFGLDFKIWQFDPVSQPLFDALTDVDTYFLKDHIYKNKFDEYEGKIDFKDDEFSDNDIAVLEWAVEFARHKVAEDLVAFTHSEKSLWRRGAIKHDVYKKFLDKELTSTNFNIDFTLLFEDEKDKFLLDKYYSSLKNLEFSKKYKDVKSLAA